MKTQPKRRSNFEKEVIDRLARIETLLLDYNSVRGQVQKNKQDISNIKTVWSTVFIIIVIVQMVLLIIKSI
ncbi:MAG: hypothetical protein H0Z28_11185 [Archaeoglobus sp.]|nr:hypothetical protein [Archaeoglobus sp.]